MLSPRRMRTWDAQRRGPRRTSSRSCAAGIRRCAINTSSSAHTSITWDGRRCSPCLLYSAHGTHSAAAHAERRRALARPGSGAARSIRRHRRTLRSPGTVADVRPVSYTAHMGRTAPRPTQIGVALVLGRDPALRDQYVVIGAHFDHLGRSPMFAMDPEAGDAIRNGADDNASGTAAVLDLARLLKANPPRRSVIFVNFSAEELGVLGSSWFVNHPPVPIERMVAMFNFDMVGRLRNDKLIVYGTSTATELKGIVDSANAVAGSVMFRISGGGDGYGPSDQSSFYAKDIPVLHFFTDLHEDYHRATDDADKINAGGEARVVDLALRVARVIADRPARLTFVHIAAPVRTAVSEEGKQTYLGTVPDMGASESKGLLLTGVRAGSPADLGGLKAGDVIVELGGVAVKDLYSYSDALYAHKPGDVVKIVVLRGGERRELSVTLGRRGGG